ncbi:dynein axonemal intermediate chain 4-like [Menidia menidia]|uniref:Dynein axonemal intermediate chain 4 n=1 Tax=Menidia menidia TaxID=238744 RepID=A0A8S4B9Q2_9TELE|nr:unnamed protein product [Menidia menidia]
MKRGSVGLNSSSGAFSHSGSGIHKGSQSSKQKFLFVKQKGSHGQHIGANRNDQTPKRAAKVVDAEGKNVTPLALTLAESGDTPLRDIFASMGSEHSKSSFSLNTGCFRLLSSSIIGSRTLSNFSIRETVTKETENVLPPLDINSKLPAHCEELVKIETMEKHVEMQDELADVFISETGTIVLMDMTSTLISNDAEDAEKIKESNRLYVQLCESKFGSEKYVNHSALTFGGSSKTKHVQTNKNIVTEKGTTATVWDMYDSFTRKSKAPENNRADSTVSTREKSSSGSSDRGNAGSDFKTNGITLKTDQGQEEIILSKLFRKSLFLMERIIQANVFQSKLAAYRHLPILKDSDSKVEPDEEEQHGEDMERTPTMERLWAFVYEPTRGYNITCMAWNKKNEDILAVAYGDSDSMSHKPCFILCWSLKNPTWPERCFSCQSCVMSLDFSTNNPCCLAVGMYDGSVAIYNVQMEGSRACIANSSDCHREHLHPVRQVTWTKKEMKLSGEEREEVLVSVSADGRITKWLFCSGRLDSVDLMKLRKIQDNKRKVAGDKKMSKNVQTAGTPGLCISFHPKNFGTYLAGTWDGPIHKCSFSNSDQSLDIYKKHIGMVNHIEWSQFYPDMFLSCSSDCTIHLWNQNSLSPVLSFSSIKSEVYSVHWSPNFSTVFAAIYRQQVEIWDLSASILHPTIVHQAAPGVKLTSMLFATESNCVLVGDSEGQVTVYRLNYLNSEADMQDDHLDLLQSISKCL